MSLIGERAREGVVTFDERDSPVALPCEEGKFDASFGEVTGSLPKFDYEL
jgi:hypothetical protein